MSDYNEVKYSLPDKIYPL